MKDDNQLQFLIRQPEEKETKNPAIFLLHGYGSDMYDLFQFSGELPKDAYVFSLQAPYDLSFGGFAWYNLNISFDKIMYDFSQVEESAGKIREFIRIASEKYNLDQQRIVLMGFSQGAILSYSLSLKKPQLARAVLAMSGYIPNELKQDGINGNEVKTKYFIAHGTQDDVIPLKLAVESRDFLKKEQIDHDYNEYPMPHGISPQALNDALNWLDKQL